jgi:predicted transcriptional regulator
MTQSKRDETTATTLEGDFAGGGHRAQRFRTFERDADCPSIPDASDSPHGSSIPHRLNTSHAGRRPAGPNGERTSAYPQVSARLPPATLARLRDLSRARRVPQCRIISDALDAYLKRQAIAGGEPDQAGGTPDSRSEKLAAPFPSDIAANPPSKQEIT